LRQIRWRRGTHAFGSPKPMQFLDASCVSGKRSREGWRIVL
jgi:hypothetical protein